MGEISVSTNDRNLNKTRLKQKALANRVSTFHQDDVAESWICWPLWDPSVRGVGMSTVVRWGSQAADHSRAFCGQRRIALDGFLNYEDDLDRKLQSTKKFWLMEVKVCINRRAN